MDIEKWTSGMKEVGVFALRGVVIKGFPFVDIHLCSSLIASHSPPRWASLFLVF